MGRKDGRLSRRAAGNNGTGNGKWESEKMEKVNYKDCTNCRSNGEWILAFQGSTFIVTSEPNSL